MSKKMKRDEKGHVILDGSQTFGTAVRPKVSNCPRTTRLKDEASTRLLLLMKKGPTIDKFNRVVKPMCKKQEEQIRFQNKLAAEPHIVQFAFHRSKMNELIKELKELEQCGNDRKYKFKEPVIRQEMAEVKKQMEDLGEVIINTRKLISRKCHD